MSKNVEKLLKDALALKDTERALIATTLIDSLDPETDGDAAAAWEQEISDRIAQIDSSSTTTIPWTEARKQILKES